MAITELVLPSLKQDDNTKTHFEAAVRPVLASVIGAAPGVKEQFFGKTLTENGANVDSDVKYALGIEWEEERHFHEFFTSDDFAPIGVAVKPFAEARPSPEVYNTDESPIAVFSSGLTEVYRVGFDNEAKLENIKAGWNALVQAVNSVAPGKTSVLSGTSLNTNQDMFLGIIGWESTAARETVVKTNGVAELKHKFEALESVSSFVTAFSPL